jgi:hypothetical protein
MSDAWLEQLGSIPPLRRRRQRPQIRPHKRQPGKSFRPSIEALEDRTLMSVALDYFSGYVGPLAGKNGGTGWNGAWQDLAPAASSASAQTIDGSLGAVSLVRSDTPYVSASFTGTRTTLEAARPLAQLIQAQPAVYVTALVSVGTDGGLDNSVGGIALYQNNNPLFLIGEPTGSNNWSVVQYGGAPAPSTVPIDGDTPTLLVARLNQVSHTLTLWVNPDLSQTEAVNVPAATLNYAGADAFDTVRLRGSSPLGDTWSFDNLVVNTDGSPFDQPGGQTDWVGQGPQLTAGGQVMGLSAQGNPVSGAIQAVAVSPTDPRVVFVGTVNGGVWRTNDINATWTVETPDPAKAVAPGVAGVRLQPGTDPDGGLTANGVYSYKMTVEDLANNRESNISDPFPLGGVTVGAAQNQITLSNLPPSPPNTIRNLYRTLAGETSYRLLTFLNNSDTTFTDRRPDDGMFGLNKVPPRSGEKQVPFPVWTPLTDLFPSLAIGSLAFDLTPPAGSVPALYAGTGQFSSSNSGGAAVGLYRSTDGGNSFQVIGQNDFRDLKITRIVAQTTPPTGNPPQAQQLVLAGTTYLKGQGGNPDRGGLLRSTDGGATWQTISGSGTGLPPGSVTDLVAVPAPAPADPGQQVFFAAVTTAAGPYLDSRTATRGVDDQTRPFLKLSAGSTAVAEWQNLHKTRHFTLTIGDQTRDVNPDFTGVVHPGPSNPPVNDSLVERLQKALDDAFGVNATQVTLEGASFVIAVNGKYREVGQIGDPAPGPQDSLLTPFPVPSGIYKSTDNGEHWVAVAGPADFQSRLRQAQRIVLTASAAGGGAPTIDVGVIVGTAFKDGVVSESALKGLYRLDNYGASVRLVTDTPTSHEIALRTALAVKATSDASAWQKLPQDPVFTLKVGDTEQLVKPKVTSLKKSIDPSAMNLVNDTIQAALNTSFGDRAVSVRWVAFDPNQPQTTGRFVFESLLGLEITALNGTFTQPPNQPPERSIFDGGADGKAAHFFNDIVAMPKFTSDIDPIASIKASTVVPSAWGGLGNTLSFSITVGGQTKDVRPTFPAAGSSMAVMATALQTAVNQAFNLTGASIVQVTFQDNFQRFVFRSPKGVGAVTAIAPPSTIVSSLVANPRAFLVAGSIKYPNPSDRKTLSVQASTGDVTLWQQLGAFRGFRLSIGSTPAAIFPDFSQAKGMRDVAIAMQTLIQNKFPPGQWGATTVDYDFDTRTFRITNPSRPIGFPVDPSPAEGLSLLDDSTGAVLVAGTLAQSRTTYGLHPNGQGTTHFSLAADPANRDLVYVGGDTQPSITEANDSANSAGVTAYAGRLFQVSTAAGGAAPVQVVGDNASGTAPHADSRALVFEGSGGLLEADDGGLYRLLNPGGGANPRRWVSLNGNLDVTEFYGVAQDPIRNVLFGGAQDVGSQEQVASNAGTWQAVNLGDGNSPGAVATDTLSGVLAATISYTMGNTLTTLRRRTFDLTGKQLFDETDLLKSSGGAKPFSALLKVDQGEEFITTALAVNAVASNRLLVGRLGLYESDDFGTTARAVTLPGKPDNAVISAIAYGGRTPSGQPVPQAAYVAAGGTIWYRAGGTNSFQSVTLSNRDTVTNIVMDPENWQVAYALAGRFLFLTLDNGQHWTDITGDARNGGLPPSGLKGLQLVKVPEPLGGLPDLRVELTYGPGFDVSLAGATTFADVKTSIENASRLAPGAAPRVAVSAGPDNNIVLTGTTRGFSPRRVLPLNGSVAARDLNLLAAAFDPVKGTLTGGTIPLKAGQAPLGNASPLSAFNNGVGARVGLRLTDVLLVGSQDGVLRAFNPAGSPGDEVYPRINKTLSATTGTVEAKNGLVFSVRQPPTILEDPPPFVTFKVDASVMRGKEQVVVGGSNPANPANPYSLKFLINADSSANDIINALLKDPTARALYTVTLAQGPLGNENDGSGKVGAGSKLLILSPADPAWTEFGLRLPNAPVSSIQYTPPGTYAPRPGAAPVKFGDTLVVGTLGRGAFKIDAASQYLAQHPVLTVTGTDGDNTIVLTRDSDNPTLLDVLVDGVAVGVHQIATIERIVVRGLGGDDTLKIDAGLRVPGGITFDGGPGTNAVVILGPANSVEGALGGSRTLVNGSSKMTVSYVNVQTPPTTVVPDALQQLHDGLFSLLFDRTLSQALATRQVPVVGRGLGGVFTNVGRAPQPQGDPDRPSGTLNSPAIQDVNPDILGDAASIFTTLLQGGPGGFLVSEIGTQITSTDQLLAALQGLDDTPGDVHLTSDGDFDVTMRRTVTGDATIDTSTLGFSLSGDGTFTLDATLHLVFGVDDSGFFIDPKSFTLTLSNLQLTGDMTATGRLGFLEVTASDGTLKVDPSFKVVIHMNDPGPDPLTGIDDGKVRPDELNAFDPLTLFTVDVQGAPNKADVVLTANFQVAAVVPGGPALFSIANTDLQLTWDDVTKPFSIDIAAAPSSEGSFLTRFLNINTTDVVNGLADVADYLQELTGQDLLATRLPVINKSLGDLIDANPTPLTFQGAQVTDLSPVSSDGTTDRFTVTVDLPGSNLVAEGVKVGDQVIYQTTAGAPLQGTIDAIDGSTFTVRYAAGLDQAPDPNNPSFQIQRTSSLGDVLRNAVGNLDDPNQAPLQFPTLQEMLRGLAVQLGVPEDQVDQVLQVGYDTGTGVLTITPTFSPGPFTFSLPLDFGAAVPGLKFDASAVIDLTVAPVIRLPLGFDLSVGSSTPLANRFFLAANAKPQITLQVTAQVPNPNFRAQIGLLGLTLQPKTAFNPDGSANDGIVLGTTLTVTLVDPDPSQAPGRITAGKLLNFANIAKTFTFTVSGRLDIDGLMLTPNVAGVKLAAGEIDISIAGKDPGDPGYVTSLDQLRNLPSQLTIRSIADQFSDFRSLTPGTAVTLLIQVGNALQSIADKLDVPQGIPLVSETISQVLDVADAVTNFARQLYYNPVITSASPIALPDAGLGARAGFMVRVEDGDPVYVPLPDPAGGPAQSVDQLIADVNAALAAAGLGDTLTAGRAGDLFTLGTTSPTKGISIDLSTTQVTAPGAPQLGQLGGGLTFTVSLNGVSFPVTLSRTALANITSIDDLAAAINAALVATAIDDRVRAVRNGSVLTIAAVSPAITALKVSGAEKLGFATNQPQDPNGAATALGLGAGQSVTADFRFNTLQDFVQALDQLLQDATTGKPFDAHLTYDPNTQAIEFHFVFKPEFQQAISLQLANGLDVGVGTLNLSADAAAMLQVHASIDMTLGMDLAPVGLSDPAFDRNKPLASVNQGDGVHFLAGLNAAGPAPANGQPQGAPTLTFQVLTLDTSPASGTRPAGGTFRTVSVTLTSADLADSKNPDDLAAALNQRLLNFFAADSPPAGSGNPDFSDLPPLDDGSGDLTPPVEVVNVGGTLRLIPHNPSISQLVIERDSFGFQAGQRSNEPDLVVTLRDGSTFKVNLSGSTTLGDIQDRIETASRLNGVNRVTVTLHGQESRIWLTDNTVPVPGGVLQVQAYAVPDPLSTATGGNQPLPRGAIERVSPAADDLGIDTEVGDTFTLTFTDDSGQTFRTAAIPAGAGPADVLTALRQVVGHDNVVDVKQGYGGGYTVTFAPRLGAVALLTGASDTGMTVHVAEKTHGSRGMNVSEVQSFTVRQATTGGQTTLVGGTLNQAPLTDQFFILPGSSISAHAEVSAGNINLRAALGLLDLGIRGGGVNFSIDAGLALQQPDPGRGDRIRLSDFGSTAFQDFLKPTFVYRGTGDLPVDSSLLDFLPPDTPSLAIRFALNNAPRTMTAANAYSPAANPTDLSCTIDITHTTADGVVKTDSVNVTLSAQELATNPTADKLAQLITTKLTAAFQSDNFGLTGGTAADGTPLPPVAATAKDGLIIFQVRDPNIQSLTVRGAAPLGFSDPQESAFPAINFTPEFDLDVANFDEFLGGFRNLSLGDITTALRKLVQTIQDSGLRGLNTPIPLINKTPDEVLNFTGGLLRAADDFLNGPDLAKLGSLRNRLAALIKSLPSSPEQAALAQAFAAFDNALNPSNTFSLAVDDGSGVPRQTATLPADAEPADVLSALQAVLDPATPPAPLPPVVQVDVHNLFNADVVAKTGTDLAPLPTAIGNGGFCFATLAANSRFQKYLGLPNNGLIPAVATNIPSLNHPDVQLGWRDSETPQTAANARVVTGTGPGTRFTISPPAGNYSQFQIYATSAGTEMGSHGGDSQMTVTLHYDTGPDQVLSDLLVSNWLTGIDLDPHAFVLASGVIRWSVTANAPDTSQLPLFPTIYGFNLSPDLGRKLLSIDVEKTGGSSSLVFFGATGATVSYPSKVLSVTGDPGGPYTVTFAPTAGAVPALTGGSATGMAVQVDPVQAGGGGASTVQQVSLVTDSRLLSVVDALGPALNALPVRSEGGVVAIGVDPVVKQDLLDLYQQVTDQVTSRSTLGDKLGGLIKKELGLRDDAFTLRLDIVNAVPLTLPSPPSAGGEGRVRGYGFQPTILVHLNLQKTVNAIFPFNLTLPNLGPVTVESGGNLSATVGGNLDLDFGFNLATFTPYVLDTTRMQLFGSINAQVGLTARLASFDATLNGNLRLTGAVHDVLPVANAQLTQAPLGDAFIIVSANGQVLTPGTDYTVQDSAGKPPSLHFLTPRTGTVDVEYPPLTPAGQSPPPATITVGLASAPDSSEGGTPAAAQERDVTDTFRVDAAHPVQTVLLSETLMPGTVLGETYKPGTLVVKVNGHPLAIGTFGPLPPLTDGPDKGKTQVLFLTPQSGLIQVEYTGLLALDSTLVPDDGNVIGGIPVGQLFRERPIQQQFLANAGQVLQVLPLSAAPTPDSVQVFVINAAGRTPLAAPAYRVENSAGNYNVILAIASSGPVEVDYTTPSSPADKIFFDVNAIAEANLNLNARFLSKPITNAITVAVSLNHPSPQLNFDGLSNTINNLTGFGNMDLHQLIAGARAVLGLIQTGLQTDLLKQLPLVGTVTDWGDTFVGKLDNFLNHFDQDLTILQGSVDSLVVPIKQFIYNNLGSGEEDVTDRFTTNTAVQTFLLSQILKPKTLVVKVNGQTLNFDAGDFTATTLTSGPDKGKTQVRLRTPRSGTIEADYTALMPGLRLGILQLSHVTDPKNRWEDVNVQADLSTFTFLVDLPLHGSDTFSADFNLGLNGLPLTFKANGGVAVSWSYSFDLGLGLNLHNGFYFKVNPNASYLPSGQINLSGPSKPEIVLQTSVALKPGTSLAAQLFFLKVTATANPRAQAPTGLSGALWVDFNSPNNDGKLTLGQLTSLPLTSLFNAGIQATAHADLTLKADASEGLPKITTDFIFDWGIGLSVRDGLIGSARPTVTFKDVTLDLGSFLGQVAANLLQNFNTYLLPVKPLIDFLNTDVPGLSDISQKSNKGRITFLTLGILLSQGKNANNPDVYRKAQEATRIVNMISNAFNFISQIRTVAKEAGDLLIDFGTFTFGGNQNGVDLSDPSAGVQADAATETAGAGGKEVQSLDDVLQQAAAPNSPAATAASELLKKLTRQPDSNGNNGLGISLPIFKNPANIFKLFTGEVADIVSWHIPRLELNLPFRQKFGPLLPVVPLYATVGVTFNTFLDLTVGFDTRGLAQTGHFTDGFYFGTNIDPKTGVQAPVFGFSLEVSVGLELNLYLASVGIEGAIRGQLTFDWADLDHNGKVYLDELKQLASIPPIPLPAPPPAPLTANYGGLNVFRAHGDVSALLRFVYEALFVEGKIDIISKSFFHFDS